LYSRKEGSGLNVTKQNCSLRVGSYCPGGTLTRGELQRRQQGEAKDFANGILLQNT